ncbi:putative malate dehydrogenase 1B [Patiria miniata]|uniref:Malate dehydrogenase, cytoplasmic n=1 Tax=Patiria miniata TaxID=46514 RepID=A0A914A3J7_PATMI|nr:putative malate dehydrogenase 1B [Patiria miniata]
MCLATRYNNMTKLVIAGCADCPYYARSELLADDLKINLPDFHIHKIVKNPAEWEIWLPQLCQKNGWAHKKSPIVWRELIDRGGKGVLIGGSNEFQEYASGYYGITSKQMSSDMTKISAENMETKLLVTAEEEYEKSLSNPLHVCITNAASPVAYHLVHEIARGDVLGKDNEISIKLLADVDSIKSVEGMKLEMEDLACPLLRNIVVTADVKHAFKDASIVIFLDEIARPDNMEKEDWLKLNAEVFTSYAKVLNEFALSEVKAIVAGSGPLNFNAFILGHFSPAVLRQNVVALSRLEENHAKSALARRIQVNMAGIVNLFIWGNAGGTTYTDLKNAKVHGCEGAIWGPPFYSRPIGEMVHDDKWLQTEYVAGLKTYKETLEGALQHPATFSVAHSIVSLLTDWWNGSEGDTLYSVGVLSEGWYDLPEDIVFSLPVKFQKGTWEVAQDIHISEDIHKIFRSIADELIKEKEVIFPPPHLTPPPGNDDDGDKKVFGQDEAVEAAKDGGKEEGDKASEADAQPAEGTNGPLSKIVEESEIDSKEGDKTTDTEKSAEDA